ncbi:T9SS type A sorting domain-containing protein [Phaeodactylibacter xiamenensis]|uniref:T9SS type A sorting domain-containing protein n=1 Tax=Phaeodactylibacter xiamenensis TaxID=1524460 RepID=UPI003CCC18E5
MRIPLLLFGLIAVASSLNAQQFREVTCGPNYTLSTYFKFGNQESISLEHNAWDIAFTAQGLQDAGIFLNEAAGLEGTELELFLIPGAEFADNIDLTQLGERLLNDETNWTSGGAFNQMRDPGNPLDYGWGQYDPATQSVEGQALFVLKLRNETFKKLEISSLDGTTYHFRYANLNGSDEQSHTLNKADFPDNDLVYWSFSSNAVVDFIPKAGDWDLLFTRYSTPLDDNEGSTLNYLLTGTLSGPGVEVAQVDGIDPATITFEGYEDSLSTDLDIIGHDWKNFDLGTFSWALPADRVYFVKVANGEVWKLFFVDFEGSSTGNIVFQETNMGVVNTVNHTLFEDISVFPNPARESATIALTLKQAAPVQLNVFNATGQSVWSAVSEEPAGFQTVSIPVSHLPAGTYWLQVQTPGTAPISQPLIVAP